MYGPINGDEPDPDFQNIVVANSIHWRTNGERISGVAIKERRERNAYIAADTAVELTDMR